MKSFQQSKVRCNAVCTFYLHRVSKKREYHAKGRQDPGLVWSLPLATSVVALAMATSYYNAEKVFRMARTMHQKD